ncbi:Alpha/Beta hydrolase protein [Leucosporidium creatinivorum]|uniref:Alpha/Beta hydrolase protein n=1 Tax=Leucosporidium creatinivorum TaxID=106004 RepID=A0A1Y2EQS0_9BASI|nr:Alpha/Beta hydrolase protein [Leucosporidium creatinivorum]
MLLWRSTTALARAPTRLFSTSALRCSSVALASDHYTPSSPRNDAGPLVILHGLFGSKQNWRSLARGLAAKTGREVHALDLRNHGTSPHAKDASYSALAGDVATFLEEKKLENITLLGHSMGGKVAMALALRPHEAIERLIVVDISPAVGKISPEFTQYLDAMKAIDAANVSSRKEADELLAKTEPDFGVRSFLLTNLEKSPSSSYYKFRLPLHYFSDAIEEIGGFPYQLGETKFEGPTLVFKGESRSKYINRRNIPSLEGFFPNMQLKTLETGHWVHAEKPKEFADDVVEFCK